MLIQIERCSLPCGWYKEIVGSIIECDKEDAERWYSANDNDWYVLKEDSRLISSEKERKQYDT